jgi:hypothetical protein
MWLAAIDATEIGNPKPEIRNPKEIPMSPCPKQDESEASLQVLAL